MMMWLLNIFSNMVSQSGVPTNFALGVLIFLSVFVGATLLMLCHKMWPQFKAVLRSALQALWTNAPILIGIIMLVSGVLIGMQGELLPMASCMESPVVQSAIPESPIHLTLATDADGKRWEFLNLSMHAAREALMNLNLWNTAAEKALVAPALPECPARWVIPPFPFEEVEMCNLRVLIMESHKAHLWVVPGFEAKGAGGLPFGQPELSFKFMGASLLDCSLGDYSAFTAPDPSNRPVVVESDAPLWDLVCRH